MGFRRLTPRVAIAAAVAATSTAAAGTPSAATTRGTFVFGTTVEPSGLDPALDADTAAARIANQMFEGLVETAPGTTRVVPELATHWKTSKNGRTWTFFLRRGVRFHDGTRFDAAAVCFNFERWYGFTGSLQQGHYLWTLVFGAFRKPEPGTPAPANGLYRGCRRVGDFAVQLRLARRTASFLAALAYPNFGIASPTALKKYDADAGEVDASGIFHPAGTYATAHPTGTGPFMFKSWPHGKSVVLVRNPHYWGKRAKLDRIVFRPIVDRLARLRALERGEVDALDEALVGEEGAIRRNPKLTVLERPSSNVGYVGINQAFPPMDKLLVREAVAYGLDRAAVARAFYTGLGRVADQFLPPVFVGHAKRVRQYSYNPAKSRALLRKAGLKLPVKVDFWYPTEASRPYMLDPKRNFERFSASLERAGFQVVPHSAPWAPDYIRTFVSGKAQLYLGGWIADYPDAANFFDSHFAGYEPQFGLRDRKLFGLVRAAGGEPSLTRRARLYEHASQRVMQLLPIVPYVYFKFPLALRRNVTGYVTDQSGPRNESFARVAFR